MNKLMTALVFAAMTFGAGSALAAGNAQQEKMKDCNKQAGDKKGDERKKFMSECLKGGAAAAPAAAPAAEKKELAPKDAMKACNAAAGDKKGDERKKFMSDCLKAKGPANMK